MKYSYTFLPLAALATADFTSIYNITATPDQVISNAGVVTPGAPGAKGQFNYAINSNTDTICYDITLEGFVGAYMSPAKTATHIHEGIKGKAGPPRIAFPNPIGDDQSRRISGCLTGPFTTGIKMADNVTDTGAGFKLSQIEANPAGFFTDSHSVLFPVGVVRGQLDQKFEILNPNDGHELTTITYHKTYEVTISKCPETKTDCPYKTQPYVVMTESVYTTVCPKSEASNYPVKTDKHDSEVKTNHDTKPAETHPAVPQMTGANMGVPSKPDETHPVAAANTPYKPAGTGSYPAPSSTNVFQGAAAGSNKAGGLLIAAGLAAALL